MSAALALPDEPAPDWRTPLLAGAIVDRVLEGLDAVEHVHALKDRPSIAKTGKFLRVKEGRLVSRVIRAFSDAPTDRAGLEAVFAVARPARKFGPSSSGIAAELLGECLVAADAVLGIWLRRHGEKAPEPVVVELPEPPPDPAMILLQQRLAEREEREQPNEDEYVPLREPLEELRDLAGALMRRVGVGSRRNGLEVAHRLLSIIASKQPTVDQEAVIDRVWAALLDDGAKIARPLPARPWLTTAELGDVLGITDRKTVVRWLEARNVPIQQPGKNIRVLVADLENQARGEWSAARKVYEQG